MIICFRCDANVEIGLGHFSRCLTLANAFPNNVTCLFIMQHVDSTIKVQLKAQLETSKHQLLYLPNQDKNVAFNQEIDNKNTQAMLAQKNIHPSLLVIDHYQLSSNWWKPFRQNNTKILVLNDTQSLLTNCDYIWNIDDNYNKLFNQSSSIPTLFTGSQYILLRNEFSLKNKLSHLKQTTKDILICIGATDPQNTSQLFIEWLLSTDINIKITLMTTSINPYIANIKSTYSNNTNIHLAVDSQNIAQEMLNHKIIITAAGTMMWEAFSLGIPCLVIQNSIHQQININIIKNNLNNDIILGIEGKLDKNKCLQIIHNLLNNNTALIKQSEQQKELCDGKGSQRLAQRLMSDLKQTSKEVHL